MLGLVLNAVRYTFSLLFGVCTTMAFLRVLNSKRDFARCIYICLCLFAVEAVLLKNIGITKVTMLYPFHTHLLFVGLLYVFYRIDIPRIIAAVLASYLCCQIPSYISRLATLLPFQNKLIPEVAVYCGVTLVWGIILLGEKGQILSGRLFMDKRNVMYFTIVPLIYYLFDYITTVWSDSLYDGFLPAIEFMSMWLGMMFPVFVFYINMEQDMMIETEAAKAAAEAQLKIVENEYEMTKRMEEVARSYRKEMSSHFLKIKRLAKEGKIEEIRSYIAEKTAGINSITPRKFCDMELLNAILSYFADQAEECVADYSFDVKLPEKLPLSNTEFCSVVSNALENAINAIMKLPRGEGKLDLKIVEYNGMLIFSVDNSFEGTVPMVKGLPVTKEEGHGYGTKSIVKIAKQHGGSVFFQTEDGMFKLMVVIPMS